MPELAKEEQNCAQYVRLPMIVLSDEYHQVLELNVQRLDRSPV
jgi:hypothetical protein